MDAVIAGVVVFLGVIIMGAAIGLLLAFPVMWTWNATMPGIFDLKTIGCGEAWCLNFLASCLIKSSQTNNNK